MTTESHRDPSLDELRSDYVAAITPWLRSFVVLSQADCLARLEICFNCPKGFWSEGRDGLGFCEYPLQNCRRHKPWLAEVECGIGAWQEVAQPHRD